MILFTPCFLNIVSFQKYKHNFILPGISYVVIFWVEISTSNINLSTAAVRLACMTGTYISEL